MSEFSNEQIRTELAELRATVLGELKHLSHQINSMSHQLGAYAPRREVEGRLKVFDEQIDRVREDVDEMKDEHKFVRRAMYGAWVAGLGFAGMVGRKLGVI